MAVQRVNLVRAIREAGRLSKPQLAEKIGKEASTINAWELEPQPNEARKLSVIATELGLHQVAHDLLVLAGDINEDHLPTSVDLRNLSDDEQQIAEWLIATYREPKGEVSKAVVRLVWAARNEEAGIARQEVLPELSALPIEAQQVLVRFLKSPNAVTIAAAVAGGGNPPSAFAKPESPPSRGEHMAKRKTS